MARILGLKINEYRVRQTMINSENSQVETIKRLNNLELKFNELSSLISTLAAYHTQIKETTQREIHEANNTLYKAIESFRSEIKNISDRVSRLCDVFASADKLIHENKSAIELKASKTEVSEVLEKCIFLDKLLKQNMFETIERYREEFKTELKKSEEKILSKPTGLPELKSELEEKIQLCDLNGQNSILRSANNEKQIILLERKIENIYQLIKKIDLNNQGA